MRKPCSEILLNQAKTSSGTFHLVPFKVYCYKSVVVSLEQLLNKPNMHTLCEKWKITERDHVFTYIYDERVWNCDWFQPFKHTQFSICILYLVVGNFPRVALQTWKCFDYGYNACTQWTKQRYKHISGAISNRNGEIIEWNFYYSNKSSYFLPRM